MIPHLDNIMVLSSLGLFRDVDHANGQYEGLDKGVRAGIEEEGRTPVSREYK